MRGKASQAIVALLLLGFAYPAVAASKSQTPDFNGTWKLNPQKSKGNPDWRPETTVVIIQGPHQIQFSYFLTPEAAQPFETRNYVPNGKEQQLYVAATEKAYVRVNWGGKNELRVRIRHVVSSEIADTAWDETDTWALSDDGHVLINKLSDGKVLVYEKQKDKNY